MEVLVCLSLDEPRPRELLAAGAALADDLPGRLNVVVVHPASAPDARRGAELWALAREFTDSAWQLRADEPEPALRNLVRLRRVTHVVR